MHDIFYPIKGDLLRVRERLNRYYRIKAGDIKEFAHLEKYAEYLCPALVLFTARMYGGVTEKVISMAQVFQFIHLASQVHCNINEDWQICENKCPDPRDGCQYPVLVGDYLYGRFFTTLCEADIVEYLGPLSEIICMINEGGIIRLKSHGVIKAGVKREIIRLEVAELTGGCCKMGGQAAGAERECQQHLYRFGFSLGMAAGMLINELFDQAEAYFNEALSILDCLGPGKGRDDLKSLVMFMKNSAKDSRKMVC
ncbi:MAG: polyprenyl synthetase family protein [Bacillota bacterium]